MLLIFPISTVPWCGDCKKGKDTSSPNLLLSSSFLAQSERAWLRFWARVRVRRVRSTPTGLLLLPGNVAILFKDVGSAGKGSEGRKKGITGTTPSTPTEPNAPESRLGICFYEFSLACWNGPVSMFFFFNVLIRMLCLFGYCDWKGNYKDSIK